MFELMLSNGAINLIDNNVKIKGQINMARRYSNNHPLVSKAKQGYLRHCREGNVKKSELIAVWKDDTIELSAKMMITLWWGRISHRISNQVYSVNNIDKMISIAKEFKKELTAISLEPNFDNALRQTKDIFRKFERGGDFYLFGIGPSFFTKWFFFWFASHPIEACQDFIPVISDKWMCYALYAELMDNKENERNQIFSNLGPSPVLAAYHGSKSDSYIEFIKRFNLVGRELKKNYPNLSPIILEDLVFNCAKEISQVYYAADKGGILLPPWIAGRYNEKEQVAIIFNNLLGESYLFEGISANLIGKLLDYEYLNSIDCENIIESLKCPRYELFSFFVQLIDNKILTIGVPDNNSILKIRQRVVNKKREFLKQSKGTENLQSVFELADTDFMDKLEKQGIPSSVSFELTYGCNEMCVHCYNPGSSRTECLFKQISTDELNFKDYCSALDQLAEIGVPKILFTGGDPFMKKDFFRILRYAHKKKFAISIYTNGQAIYNNPKYYQDVIDCYPHTIGLSLYSTVPEIHEAITRVKGSCKKTMTVAEKFSKDGIGLLIKCPIMRVNKDTYRDVYSYAISINSIPEFDVNITSSVDGDLYAIKNLRLSDKELSDILKDPIIPLSVERKNIAISTERELSMPFCGAGINSMNVQPNGDVTPCLAFTAICGNIKEQRIREIWNNSNYLKRIRKLTYSDSDKCGRESYCKYCNRCIGQSYTEKGIPENYSTDNCFIAKIREKIYIG